MKALLLFWSLLVPLVAQDPLADFDHVLPGKRLAAARALAARGPAALPLLKRALGHASARVRRAGTDAAAALAAEGRILQPTLQSLLADPVAWVRAGAAQALGMQGPLPDAVVTALVARAADPDLFVRSQVMETLARRRVTPNHAQLCVAAARCLQVPASGWAAKRFAVELLKRHGKTYRKAIPALKAVLAQGPEGMWDQSEQVARLLFGMDEGEYVLGVFRKRLGQAGSGGRKRDLRVLGKLGALATPLRPQIEALLRAELRRDERKAVERALAEIPQTKK